MRTQLVTATNPAIFQENLNREIYAIEKKWKVNDIKFSTCFFGSNYEMQFSALIIYEENV